MLQRRVCVKQCSPVFNIMYTDYKYTGYYYLIYKHIYVTSLIHPIRVLCTLLLFVNMITLLTRHRHGFDYYEDTVCVFLHILDVHVIIHYVTSRLHVPLTVRYGVIFITLCGKQYFTACKNTFPLIYTPLRTIQHHSIKFN